MVLYRKRLFWWGGRIMDAYRSIRDAAEQWGVSERRVNQFCAEGRIPGARKFGGAWAIPVDAEKPADPRRTKQKDGAKGSPQPGAETVLSGLVLMPLMNTPFQPGHCMEAVRGMSGLQGEIALAEYHYFSGQPEAAVREAEAHLTSPDTGARLSACLICGYANLSLGQIRQARFALEEMVGTLRTAGKASPPFQAAAGFAAATATVLLHLPLPEGLPPAGDFLPLLPAGLRFFAMYVQAHYLYLREDYGRSAGMVEATLSLGAERYPIPAIYLHLVAVMDYMSLRQTDRARGHLLAAWELARPDDLIEGLGEHHGLLGGMLEAVIKPKWPEDFRRIIDITYRFSAGWRRVHNPETGHDVADDLTTTEFAACMLAARGWTNSEIAAHMGVSPNTVKRHISIALDKLHIRNRKDLKQFMLQ